MRMGGAWYFGPFTPASLFALCYKSLCITNKWLLGFVQGLRAMAWPAVAGAGAGGSAGCARARATLGFEGLLGPTAP